MHLMLVDPALLLSSGHCDCPAINTAFPVLIFNSFGVGELGPVVIL